MSDPLPYVRAWLGHPVVLPEPSPALLSRAEREGVGGIVASQLGLRERTLAAFRASAEHLASLERLAPRLAAGGLEVVALKGGALLPTVYAGQLSCRPLSDLDLLVRPEQVSGVRAEAAGLPVTIDWHTHLVDHQRIPSKLNLCRLSLDEIWSLTEPWQPGVRHLASELQFIHLALHAFKHSCCRLIWLVDLALVARRCQAEKVLTLARRVGAERPVLLAAGLLERLLGEDFVSARLRGYERLFLELACRRGREWPWGEIFLMLSGSERLTYLREYLFLGRGWRASGRRLWRFLTNPGRTRGAA